MRAKSFDTTIGQIVAVALTVLLAVSLPGCDSNTPTEVVEITTVEAIPAMNLHARPVTAPFPVGLGVQVDPSDLDAFGMETFAREGLPMAAKTGPGGEFEILLMLGEYGLQYYSTSTSSDSVARVTVSGVITPRAVKTPSIMFDPNIRVVANVAPAFQQCNTFDSCWLRRYFDAQSWAGDVTDKGFSGGQFRGTASSLRPYGSALALVGAVLKGKCDPNRLGLYMVVEGKLFKAMYLSTNPDVGPPRTGDYYIEFYCQLAPTPAASEVLPGPIVLR